MFIINFKILIISLIYAAELLCSSVLFPIKTYEFKRGVLKNRSMVYSVEKPLNWNGKTLVFIPGFSRNMAFWNKHADLYLSKGYRIFRYDAFNIGKTLNSNGVLSESDGFSFFDDTNAVMQILKNEGIKGDITLVGHSLGSAKAVYLAREMEKRAPDVISKVLIASPFVRFLTDYYDEKNAEDVARPFLFWNPLAGIPILGQQIDAQVEFLNENLKSVSANLVEAGSSFFSPLATRESIRVALKERSDEEQTGIEPSIEEDALFEIMKSLEDVNILKTISKLKAEIHLITGDDDELTVPQELILELKESAQESMSHTVIKSDHFTPSRKKYFKWLGRFL